MKKILFGFLYLVCLNAKSLVVLEPAAAEILLALGAKDNIKALSFPQRLDIYPSDMSKDILSVGSYVRPSIEKIVSLKPDLVLVGHHSVGVGDDLKKFGIETMKIESNTILDMKANIKKLAKIVEKEDEATKLIKEIDEKLSTFKLDEIKNKKALLIFSSNPLMVFCKNNLADDIINQFGMINLCDKQEPNVIVNIEYILSKNPDYIIYAGTDDVILQNPMLKNTNAYKQNNIVKIPAAKILRASPRILVYMQELLDMLRG